MEKMEIEREEELGTVAKNVLTMLKERSADGAAVLALHGDLGAGKTAFVKALARELGVADGVTSPTFVILKLYPLDENKDWSTLAHIDAYRIEDIDEMRPLRFADLLLERNTIIAIEWAEKIGELLPKRTLHMMIDIAAEGEKRTITFS
jgi:tRNA threonylcarbamoyladenosine biosynthesis protein TsaE